jgi:hypothetical protein
MDGVTAMTAARHGTIERQRAILVCSILIAIVFLALGFYARDARPLRVAATGDDDLTTGSIVFVPIHGNRCRNRLIDNTTWRIRDNGYVDCKEALAQYTTGPRLNLSAARASAIRRGFNPTTP